MWIGSTGGGLTRFDPSAERFSNFRHDPDDPDSLIPDTVFALREDSEGTPWVGAWGGLDRFDRETGVFAHCLHDEKDENSLGHNAVRGIREDADGYLWIATTFGGINRPDPKTGRFSRYAKEPDNPGSLSDNNVWRLFIDGDGTLWAGASQAPNRFDPKTETFVHYRHDPKDPNSISDNLVINMHEDRDGVLWLATPAGLNRMDRSTGRFRGYTVRDGLPRNTVESIVEDGRGFLWLSTDKGVSKFDPREETFFNYDVSDGLQGDKFYGSAYLKTRDGEIYFGGPDGLDRFHPDRIRNNPHPPPVVLTDFLVFNESAPIGPDALMPKQVGYVGRIVLYPRHSRFAFEFAALDYAAPGKNRYAYMLEGFDRNWTFADSERRFATYTNLNPGQYVFRVKASNNDGVWNEEGASVRVVVRPAWWNTWAFRSFLALAAGCLL